MARRFVDARGTEWEVWEGGARAPLADSPAAPVRRSGAKSPAPTRWLRFESPTQRRRLAPYPANWEALGAIGLEELCRAAVAEAPPALGRPAVSLAAVMWLGEG